MTNLEYVTALIKSNDRIYIDTSALMNVEELELLASKIQDILVAEGKMIIVPRVVCLELLRHFEGSDTRKKDLSVRVFDVLSRYESVFSVQDVETDGLDLMKVFADAKLLAELTENKSTCKQLLITNDRNLGHDAYDLNKLASCRGHAIKVCYLNRFGELHRCDCVKDQQDQSAPNEPRVEVREVVKIQTVKETPAPEPWFKKIALPATTLILGIVVGRYSSNAFNYLAKSA